LLATPQPQSPQKSSLPKLERQWARVHLLFRALVLVALAAGFAMIRLNIDPEAQSLFVLPELASDEVSFQSAQKLNPVWIDARSRAAYERRHIPGARLLTLDKTENFEELLFGIDSDNLLDGSRPVVVYCSSSSCQLSREVAGRLRDRYPELKVFVLHGGWR
jgi:rhodanese-related sulfurtransferase